MEWKGIGGCWGGCFDGVEGSWVDVMKDNDATTADLSRRESYQQ